MKKIILLFIAILALSSYGQKKITLSGYVKEKLTGEVLIGANVSILKDTTKSKTPFRGASTNKYGFYSLPSIPEGEYIVIISSVGFGTLKEGIIISESGGKKQWDFELAKRDLTLDEVVIEDRRINDFAPVNSTIKIDPILVQKLPSLGGETDIFRALQLLPGVSSSTEISTGIYVRGGSSSENLTLIDGVNVYNPSHLGGFASTFNSDVLRNINLIKGAFPAEYGGRLSSVLDITMREGSREKFMGNIGVNFLSSRASIEGPLDTNITFILSARVMYLDKILPLSEKFNNIPRYNFLDFNAKVNYVLSDKNRLFFSGFYSSDNIIEPPVNTDIGFNIQWSNAIANVTWTELTSPAVFSNTSIMYTSYKFSTLIKDKLPVKDPLDFYTASIVSDFTIKREMQFFISEDNVVKAGAEFVMHNFNTTTSDLFLKELQYKRNYGKTINALEASLFAQNEWQIFSNLKTNIGARLYYFQSANFLKVEPRVSLTYYLYDRLILRGAFATSHQTLHMLTRNDVYLPTDVWYPSTEKIKPSSATQGAIGFEATSADRTFLFSMEGYYKSMDNLYEYKDNADFSIESDFENQVVAGTGSAYGVEFFLNKRIGDVTGWIGYTVAYTKRKFEGLNKDQEYYPRYDRRHDISIVLTYQPVKSLNFGATWTYGTGQAYFLPLGQYLFPNLGNPNSQTKDFYYEYSLRDAFRLPAFHKLDLSAQYTIEWDDKSLELTLNVYNAYNRYNAFTKYIGYKLDPVTNEKIPILKQFTLFPFLPTFGVNYRF